MLLPIGITQQAAGGGTPPAYAPGMMTFNGTNAYYSKTSVTVSGSSFTFVLRFNINSFTGDKDVNPFRITAGQIRVWMQAISSDYTADASFRNKIRILVRNSAGSAWLVTLLSLTECLDGNDHLLFFSYNGTTGAATFYIDGVTADDTGWGSRILTTGTAPTSSATALVGGLTTSQWVAGDIGYFGYRDVYLTNPTDFYHPINGLQELDESGWTEWGAQPLFWNQYGTMTANAGSGGNMTANGTITGPA